MKTFLILVIALGLTACAGGGSSGGGSTETPIHVPDNTPHNYQINIARTRVGPAMVANFEMQTICDFGFSTAQTNTNTTPLSDANPNTGMAMSNCKNGTLSLKNLGTVGLVYVVQIDGAVVVNNLTLLPGQEYFQQWGF